MKKIKVKPYELQAGDRIRGHRHKPVKRVSYYVDEHEKSHPIVFLSDGTKLYPDRDNITEYEVEREE